VGPTRGNASPGQNPAASCGGGGAVCFETRGASDLGAGETRPECPLSGDGRLHTVAGANLTFVRSCDTELIGDDLGWFPTVSMQDCLALCAQLHAHAVSSVGRCEGVTWVYGDGPQGSDVNFCFTKTRITASYRRGGTESGELWTWPEGQYR